MRALSKYASLAVTSALLAVFSTTHASPPEGKMGTFYEFYFGMSFADAQSEIGDEAFCSTEGNPLSGKDESHIFCRADWFFNSGSRYNSTFQHLKGAIGDFTLNFDQDKELYKMKFCSKDTVYEEQPGQLKSIQDQIIEEVHGRFHSGEVDQVMEANPFEPSVKKWCMIFTDGDRSARYQQIKQEEESRDSESLKHNIRNTL